MPASEGRDLVQASYGQADRVFEIDEVSGLGTVVKCMGRTFSAVAADGEVTISDVTDITRPVRLGVARGRDADGRWRIIGPNEQDVLTTASLLRAATTLRQVVGAAFTASAGRGQ